MFLEGELRRLQNSRISLEDYAVSHERLVKALGILDRAAAALRELRKTDLLASDGDYYTARARALRIKTAGLRDLALQAIREQS